MQPNPPLNSHHIVEALTAIHTQGADPASIKIANDFISQCQTHPLFSTTLLSIYCQSNNHQLQMSSLLLLTNVIKRNWNAKRSTSHLIRNEVKQALRPALLQAYFLHDLRHYKHFNALLGYLTRLEYPSQYEELHQFVLNSLTQLIDMVKNDISSVLNSNRVLVVLSTCKVILKEYSLKKIAHNQEAFNSHISSIIEYSMPLSGQLYQLIKQNAQAVDKSPLVGLFECMRKIDKVILYCLGSMPTLYQYNQKIKDIIGHFVTRVEELSGFFGHLIGQGSHSVCQQIEKYFTGIIEQLGRMQNYYPFIYSDFLKEYLFFILGLLVKDLPKAKYFQSQKLMSAIIIANFKPLTSFAYYQTSEEFKNSIYSRKKAEFDNTAIQQHCHSIFRQVYTSQSIPQLIQTIISKIMTAPHVLSDHKQFSDDLVLQDVQISVIEQPNDTSVYDNCITLLKNIIKCFKEETLPIITAMIVKVQELKSQTDRYSSQILANILEVVLVIPHIYDQKDLPIQQVCQAISAIYDAGKYGFLSRVIRKYHRFLPAETVKGCFSILAQVVATPIGGSITTEIIYQSALGLKTLLSEMDAENVPIELLASCITNIVSLVKMKEFLVSPTLLWPIINLLIRIVKNMFDINYSIISDAVTIIIHGLSSLLSSDKNEELIVCGVAELIATLFYCSFKGVKEEYPIRGHSITPSEKVSRINSNSFIAFQASIIFLKCNIHNRSLQNYDTIYQFWLTLMRCYPTLYQQQLYNFPLGESNGQLADFFKDNSQELLEDNPIIFLEILEEYMITELVDLGANELMNIVQKSLEDVDSDERRFRIILAGGSLYYSFSLLKGPVMDIFRIFFKELSALQFKISPQANALRTFLFLMFSHHLLNNSAVDLFQFFTNCSESLGSWLLPFLWGMHFVTNKFAFKLNSAALLKAISDFSAPAFAEILKTQYNNQYAIDQFLKIFTIQTEPLNAEFMYNSYYNAYRILLPNELTPDFGGGVTPFRKIKLHLSDPFIQSIVSMDMKPGLKLHLTEVMKCLDWSSADIEQRVGQRLALEYCQLLGWEPRIV